MTGDKKTPHKEEVKHTSDRQKALELAVAQIEKQFGKGSIMKLGSHVKADVDAIPSGALTLDVALGINGFPRGRIIEIFGPEASGKTTLTLSVIKKYKQREGCSLY